MLQLCPTLCNPMDYSLAASSVHGILQAIKLEWVAIPSSRGSYWPRNWTQVSCIAGGFFTIWATREVLCWFFAVQQSYSVTHIHTFFFMFFSTMVYHRIYFLFKDFFWCGPFLKSFIDFVTILLLFFHILLFWSWGWGMWDLWSLVRDQTWIPCTERQSLNHWTTREVPLPQDTEYSYLCYTVGPCCLSTLYIGLDKKFIQKSNRLQFSCLENSVDRGAWQAKVHGVVKSHTRLSD